MSDYQELTLLDAEAMLSFCNPSADWPEWSRLGRAISIYFGDKGKGIFEDFSKCGDFNQKKFDNAWKSFKKTNATNIGALVNLAKEGGWVGEKKEYTAEEKKQFAILQAERKKQQKIDAKLAAENKIKTLLLKHKDFQRYKAIISPKQIGQYLTDKQLINAHQLVNLRRDNKSGFTARPFWSDIGNKGDFCGYERLTDKRWKGKNKLACKYADTNRGFTTIGMQPGDELPTEIFVGGGFADCLIGHMANSKVWLSVVGEGQISEITKRLKKQYPNINFIVAPDNDKAGLNVAKESGCRYVLPVKQNDWWDVWFNEGFAALQQQLEIQMGFKVVSSDSRYLEAEIKKGLNLLKAGMGSGKTTLVKNFIINNPTLKTLIISHRKALAQSLKTSINQTAEKLHRNLNAELNNDGHKINVDYYEDLIQTDNPNDFTSLHSSNCLIISVDSLSKLAGTQWDFVFVDEIEQNLCHTFASTNKNSENNLSMLNFFLKNTTYQVLADAHLGELTTDFCFEIGLHSGIYYKNIRKSGIGKTINIYENKHHLSEFLTQELLGGQRSYVFANSKEEVKKIEITIKRAKERNFYSGKMLVVHADVKDNLDVKIALENIKKAAPSLDVMVASPTLGTGFDIPAEYHQFESAIGFLNSWVGSSEEGHQGLNRAREITEFNVYLDPAQRNEPTDSDYINEKLLTERSTETLAMLEIDKETGNYARKHSLYEWLYCKVKAKLNLSKNDYKGRFIALAKEDGYTINYIENNKIAAKFGKQSRDTSTERNNRIKLRQINDAPVHVGDAYTTMQRNTEPYTYLEVAKSRIAFDLNLLTANEQELDDLYLLGSATYRPFSRPGEDYSVNTIDDAPVSKPVLDMDALINSLTFAESNTKFVSKIRKLSNISLNKHVALKLDKREVELGKSAVNWRHRAKQQEHKIEILKNVGIDSELNSNGFFWTSESLRGPLTNWLKNKSVQDELCKYSGVTVSANTLENPVQWLNSYLNSHGLRTESIGKRRVNGASPRNAYRIDAENLEVVKTLVNLRNRGIELSMAEKEESEHDYVNQVLLLQEITEFLKYAQDEAFTTDLQERFERLYEQAGELQARDSYQRQLTESFDQIKAKYDVKAEQEIISPVANVSMFELVENKATALINRLLTHHDRLLIKPAFDDVIQRTRILSDSKAINNKLTQAWANPPTFDPIITDPPLAPVLYDQVAKGGSPISSVHQPYSPLNTIFEEKEEAIKVPSADTHIIDSEYLNNLTSRAVEELKLPVSVVTVFVNSYADKLHKWPERSLSDWVLVVRDAYVAENKYDLSGDDYSRLVGKS